MGTLHVALTAIFNKLGIEVIIPPPCSDQSLARATQFSPEWVCVPYKLVLGNYLDALDQGANVLILLGGPNNCRFGYYSILQEKVLKDVGYDFEMLTPEISSRTISGVIDILRRLTDHKASSWECWSAVWLGLTVLNTIDEIERSVWRVRARELHVGSADKIFDEACEALSRVDGLNTLKQLKKEYLKRLAAVPVDRERDPLRIEIVGEIYVAHEPYINQNIERELGKRGVEVRRAEQISQWLVLSPALILESVGLGHEAKIAWAAKPYLEHLHGETIGQTVMAVRSERDGVVHLTPFTCTPEIVNLNVLPRLQQDLEVPVLSLTVDEQTSQTGFTTRIEAFVDLLSRRRARVP
jgi:predicted nucleotide-binding protein (sugar kinase/HSP70/actin superfamily)